METITCMARHLNTNNPIETSLVQLTIKENEMQTNIVEQEIQARLDQVETRLLGIEALDVERNGNKFLLTISRSDWKHLSETDKTYIANCNKVNWMTIEYVVIPEENREPKFYKSSVRNEEGILW